MAMFTRPVAELQLRLIWYVAHVAIEYGTAPRADELMLYWVSTPALDV